ncbi:MAG: hypothetical protein KC619_31260 [Myxococcales bacterium]|nr:hypothetical protein [Myxococcales bacterium]
MLAIRTLAILAVGLLGAPSMAFAQLPDPPASPPEADVLQAREAFLRGMEFAGERRFEDARREFVHSYALSGSPVALFNLASTLRSLGEHRQAGEAFERLLADPSLPSPVRSQAQPMYADVVTHVARLRLHGELEGATLRIDREPARPLSGGSVTVVVDPGAHDLAAERLDQAWRWSGTLEAGAARDLLVTLSAATEVEHPDAAGGNDDALWIGVGAGAGAVVVAIVAIVVGVVVDGEAQLEPRTPLVLELP